MPTLIVSTDPAHSLSDSLDQDISGGVPVRLSGTDLPVWGMEIDPEEAREELRRLARQDGGNEFYDMMGNVGLGSLAEQLKVCAQLLSVARLPSASRVRRQRNRSSGA